MKAFKEITEWDSDFAVPNHVYFLNDAKDKMYGYAPGGGQTVKQMKTPYRFHTRGRKFKEVANTWRFSVDEPANQTAGRSWQVVGSRGNQYTVNLELGTWSCTCSGFKFRSQCRHVEEISSTVSKSLLMHL